MRVLAVALGGALGTLARWAVGLLIGFSGEGFPMSTFVVNVSGALGLGLVGSLLLERMTPFRHLRAFLGNGFFGAYTTFSGVAIEGVRLIDSGRQSTALLYWGLTLVFGQMAGTYGMWIGRVRHRHEEGGRHETRRDRQTASHLHR
jgi:CrcB protein